MAKPIQVTCTSCGGVIPAGDLDLSTKLAKCRTCDCVISFADKVGGDAPAAPRSRIPVAAPKGISIREDGSELEITRRWFSPVFFFLIFFCLFWDGFLVVWYGIAFSTNGPLVMKLFPLIHVAVGFGLTYFTIAGFVNRTVIRVSLQALSVTHKPMFWPGNIDLPTPDVAQVFTEQKISHGKNGVSITHVVFVRSRGGHKHKLVSGLQEKDEALYIEQEIERFLGIKDQPVEGEVSR